MQYPESSRDPIRNGESYPISRAALDSALAAEGVEHLDLVYFMRGFIDDSKRPGPSRVLTGDFRAATREHPERLELRIHALPAELNPRVRAGLAPEVLSAFAGWFRHAETAENVWRSTNHSITVSWNAETIHVEDG